MKGTIFFDLDGTLIDTSERHYRVYKNILDFYGIPNTLSKEEFWNQKRNSIKTVELLPRTSSDKLIQKFMDEWLKRIEDKRYLKYDNLLPGSLDVLSILKDKADLTLVTLRNNRENLFWELSSFGLTKYFKEILVDSPVKLKNKTTLVRGYIERYSKGDNFIIVGDTEADISAGKELGMLTVAVNYGIRSKEFLTKLKPDFCLDNLSEILKLLEKTGDKL
jgi:phosphoglycolate phosphatase